MPIPTAPKHGRNPIRDWLDTVGLPWSTTRGELAARYGVHADNPFQWDLVPLELHPPALRGMLWPFSFQAYPRYSPAMPPGTLSTYVSVGNDASANVGFAAEQFAPYLGAKTIVDRWNTRRVDWRCGTASVHLIVWPPGKQSRPKPINRSHDRDPRLVTACLVTVRTGWQPPITPAERGWLDGFVPIGTTRVGAMAPPLADFGQSLFAETELEFTREAPADVARFRGVFGLSADGKALIFCENGLYLIPLARIAKFDVTRTLPGKSPGGSEFLARCDTGYAACPTKSVRIVRGANADDLNDIAAKLAMATGKPLEIGAYDMD